LNLAGGPGAARGRFDLVGTLLAAGGLLALVSGCGEVAASGWHSPAVLGLLAASAALLTAFVLFEARVADPLLPLRVVWQRNRGGAHLTIALALASLLGLFLLLTYELQVVRGYSPVQAGLAFLPLSAMFLFSSTVLARRLLPLLPPRALMVPGLLVAASGLLLLTRLQPDSGYLSLILPVELLLGLGIGCVMVPAISVATQGVDPRDAGVASAMVNTAQQVGGSLGAALFNSIAATVAAAALAAPAAPTPLPGPAALVQGYAVAAGWGAAILLTTALLAGLLVTAARPRQPGSHQPAEPNPAASRTRQTGPNRLTGPNPTAARPAPAAADTTRENQP
jgi:MFS transporter